jgi:hypothetical protein
VYTSGLAARKQRDKKQAVPNHTNVLCLCYGLDRLEVVTIPAGLRPGVEGVVIKNE